MASLNQPTKPSTEEEDHKINGGTLPKQEKSQETPQKPGFAKRISAKLKKELPFILLMFKGAMPPTIALAAYRSDAWAEQYTTLGYLIAIMSLLAMAIQPRAKFIQAMITSIIFTCVGAAVALLQIQCAVAARQSTTAAPPSTVDGSSGSQQANEYNASAMTVAAIFLCFTVFVVNLGRAFRPQMAVSIIQYSIFTLVSSTYAGNFPHMEAGTSFVKRLLKTFLTGFAIATGVSLFILPMTSRTIAGKQMAGLLGLMKAAIGAHGAYMESIAESMHVPSPKEAVPDTRPKKLKKKNKMPPTDSETKAQAVKQNMIALGELFAKMRLEIGFAKKEIAFGKLRPEDFSELFQQLGKVLLPIFGMSTFIDIMNSVKSRKQEEKAMLGSDETLKAIRQLEEQEWEELISMSHDAFVKLKAALITGLTHVSYTYELVPKPKASTGDVEKDATANPDPGDAGFSEYLNQEVEKFHKHRESAIRRWCDKKGIDLPLSFWSEPSKPSTLQYHQAVTKSGIQSHNQQQLYLMLYIEYLIHATGKAILKLCLLADSKVADGTMGKKRLIFPGWRRLRKLIAQNFRETDSEHGMIDGDQTGNSITIGDSLKTRKDPEHLPPTNAYQRITHQIRKVADLMASDEAAFAFRATVASISLGVLAFLRQTHAFFLQQRGVWALIMVAISMDSHAGRGIFGFLARIFGTFVAMCAAIAIWYIGYHHAAAIVPVFFIYISFGILFLLKNPQYAIVAVISMVTCVLIIGYELQENKVGLKATETNGQAYYEIYILGPYRLATVCAGLGAAFFWTYVPYPVTTHSTLRKDLGRTLYLMANFYSCVHTTVDAKLRYGSKMDGSVKGSPMYKLDKARQKVFGKVIVMLGKLREHSHFSKFEPSFGGKFPRETYDELIVSMQHMFNYMSLIAYSSHAFTTEDVEESMWLQNFRKIAAELQLTKHEMTSTLCLVSASVLNKQPLPPYLQVPQPFGIADRMEAVDSQILSIKHVNEPCYAAFAVLEVASSLITEEMAYVVKKVQDLVGEVDFSFHVISTNSDNASIASTLFDPDDKGKKD